MAIDKPPLRSPQVQTVLFIDIASSLRLGRVRGAGSYRPGPRAVVIRTDDSRPDPPEFVEITRSNEP
jgi:hypothetical protein